MCISDKHSFTVRVTGVLIEDNKILLVKQKVNDTRNWSLPGGKLKRGETIEQGIIREMKEETGLDVEVKHLITLCDSSASMNSLLHITFMLKRIDGKIELPSNEFENNPIYDVKFVDISELPKFGFSEKFTNIVQNKFPCTGNYVGDKKNIGLDI